MPIVTKNVAELENKKIDSYQNITVIHDLDTMLIINDGSLYSICAQDLMTYVKDHPDITNIYTSKKELIDALNLKIDKTEKGIANGVVPLNENEKVPSKHILFGKTSGTTYHGSDGKTLEDNLNAHKSNFNNPHKITSTTINLENVDNTSDADKPVSIATQNAIDSACSNSNGHTDTSVSEHNLSESAHATKFNQKLDNTSASTFIKDVSYNSESSVFTFTKYDNTTLTIDTPLEEVVKGGYYKEDTQELVLILVSGQEIKIPVTGLISEYTGETSASIQVVISADNKITANLVGNGVTRILLSTELQTSLTSLETDKHTHPNKSAIDSLTAAKITAWDNKSSFDGNYNNLTNKPTIPSPFELKVATTTLGGIKSGTDITVDAAGNVSVNNDSHTHDGRYFTETETTTKFDATNTKLETLRRYAPIHTISGNDADGAITQFIRDLGFTLNNTVIELWNMAPTNSNILNIMNNSNTSVFNKSLPVASGGIISIIREGVRGYIEFVDYRTNKKYIKSNVDNVWSKWSEIVTSNIIGNTNISNIGNGTLTGGLSTISSNLEQCFQSASNGKTAIANAVAGLYDGVISNTSTFSDLASWISKQGTYGKWYAINNLIRSYGYGDTGKISAPTFILVPKGGSVNITCQWSGGSYQYTGAPTAGYPRKNNSTDWTSLLTGYGFTKVDTLGQIVNCSNMVNNGGTHTRTVSGKNYGIEILNLQWKSTNGADNGRWFVRYMIAIVY